MKKVYDLFGLFGQLHQRHFLRREVYMFKRVAINHQHWPDTRRLLCGTTAADEAKAVPVISPLSCPLVASEACHWSPDCDVTYWREKVPQGQSTKTQVIEDFRIVNWPKRIQYCNLMSQNPITTQKNAERQVEVQSRLREKATSLWLTTKNEKFIHAAW